jgi:hypothetical protein
MHLRPHKLDAEATAARNFASKFSYVSLRVHPESDPPHGCEYLAGLEDIGKRREEVFERDGNRCVDCGSRKNLQLAHGGKTKIERCWCPENLKTKCKDCHSKNDHHGRF